MQQLNMITQENAASSDQLTQSSDQLLTLAQNLQEAVGYFNIGNKQGQSDKQTNKTEEKSQPQTTEQTKPKVSKKSGTNKQGPIQNLSNLEKEFDLDNYEKF